VVVVTDTSLPPGDVAQTSTFDLDSFLAGLFGQEEPEEPEATASPDSPEPTASIPATEEDDHDERRLSEIQAIGAPVPLPRIGIWFIWLVAIVGATGVVLGLDELRRRGKR